MGLVWLGEARRDKGTYLREMVDDNDTIDPIVFIVSQRRSGDDARRVIGLDRSCGSYVAVKGWVVVS